MGRNPFIVTTALAVVLLGTDLAAGQVNLQSTSAMSNSSSSDVFVFGSQNAVRPGSSTLARTARGISLTVNTSRLMPGNVYTVWWVVFNQPQNCAAAPCGAADLPGTGGNPAVNASVFWATGSVADASGLASFAAHTAPGEIEGEVAFGLGLTNPLGAEVHGVVRDHGPPDDLLGQLIQANSCNPTCEDVQAVIHLP
jgi:hypothetical protein